MNTWDYAHEQPPPVRSGGGSFPLTFTALPVDTQESVRHKVLVCTEDSNLESLGVSEFILA